MSMFFGLMLSPLVAVLFISIARYVSQPLRALPDSALKRLLFFSWST